MTVVVVTGTGTEVGKTWALVRVLQEWPTAAPRAVARKPAQSYAPAELGRTDAELLAAVTGEPATNVCPPHRWYETPMAPPMAAAALGRPPFTIADLAAETLESAPSAATILVEGAGGPRSPLASDGDNVDLARALGARAAVLVADAGLGTINAVRLCVDALVGFDTVILLNRFVATDDLHVANRDWLAAAGYPVVVDTPALVDAIAARVP
jgi:dethiobiotin synthetase